MAIPRDDPMRREAQRIARRSLGARSVRGEKLAEDATVTPASHTHPETEISDGALLARLAADEQITGNWRVAGITGEFIPQSSSGAPTHSASRGTPYVDLATGDNYTNTDGGTTWIKIGPGSAGAHEIDGASHTATTPLSVAKGGTGAATLTDHGVLLGSGTAAVTPMAALTKGQLLIGQSAADPTALAIGTDTHVLTLDSAQALGVKWAAAAGGGAVATDAIWDAKGDLAVATGADVAVRLPAGANHSVLQTLATEATGLIWRTAPRLAAIADTGGTDRLTIATSAPHVTVNGLLSVAGASGGVEYLITISPTVTGTTQWLGIQMAPDITLTGNNKTVRGVFGAPWVRAPAGSTGHTVQGFFFSGNVGAEGSATFANVLGIDVEMNVVTYTPGTTTVQNLYGGRVGIVLGNYGGTGVVVNTGYGLYVRAPSVSVPDGLTLTNYYGLVIENTTLPATVNRLLEVGGVIGTLPYLRVVGNFTAAANQTPIYISQGVTPTLRQLRTRVWDATAGHGFTNGDLVCILV